MPRSCHSWPVLAAAAGSANGQDGTVPEGDTVWLAAKRLHAALAGRTLRRFELRVPRFAAADLTGREVTAVTARGKHLLTRIGGGVTLHSHLRLDGEWLIHRASELPGHRGAAVGRPGRTVRPGRTDRPEHQVRAVLANDEWAAVGYRVHDIALLETAREDTLVGHLGPDLLGPDWDPEEAVRRLTAQPDRAVGEALLDQRNLAGVGNIYKAEILFIQRLNPWAPTAAVPDLRALVDTAHRLLYANRDHPEQSTTGSLRRGEQHWVHGRAGRPCRRCGGRIQVAGQGAAPYARLTFWCPACQPAADQPATDQPEADQPEADQPATDQPTASQPGADQPEADQHGLDQHGLDQHAVDQHAVDQQAAEDPREVVDPGGHRSSSPGKAGTIG